MPNGAAYISTIETGGAGAVYQVAPQGDGSWITTRIAHFRPGRAQGGVSNLVLGSGGIVFGLDNRGFKAGLFELTPPGGGGTAWTTSFIAAPSEHGYGLSSLALGFGGTLVGVIYGDQDAYGGGAIAIAPPAQGSGSWTSSVLWNFGRGPDTNPISINTGPRGLYYGTMNNTYDNGAVYQLSP